jgi:hypothetical protein
VKAGSNREMTRDDGCDAQTKQYGHLVDAGVIAPPRSRSALQNAASTASFADYGSGDFRDFRK